MTLQEIFDIVSDHLITQNKVSREVSDDPFNKACAYRGADGLKCAIGVLIPDDKYDPGMEGRTASALLYNYPGAVNIDLGGPFDTQFLDDLQLIHDQKTPKEWERELGYLAAHYNLNTYALTAAVSRKSKDSSTP